MLQVLEVSQSTFDRWRNQDGGMKAEEAKRLKEVSRPECSLGPDRQAMPLMRLQKNDRFWPGETWIAWLANFTVDPGVTSGVCFLKRLL